MSKHWKRLKNHEKTLFRNVPGGTGSINEEFYGQFKKLIRNSEYSKSDNFKKLSVLGQIRSFL